MSDPVEFDPDVAALAQRIARIRAEGAERATNEARARANANLKALAEKRAAGPKIIKDRDAAQGRHTPLSGTGGGRSSI